MKVDEMFPTKYLSASDLGGKKHQLTCDVIVTEAIGQEQQQKPVLYFKGTQKGLVLNKTNATIIAEQHGSDSEEWNGKSIVLYPTKVEFGGKMVDAIRVEPIGTNPEEMELAGDDIPF